jgi:hypothetical protein
MCGDRDGNPRKLLTILNLAKIVTEIADSGEESSRLPRRRDFLGAVAQWWSQLGAGTSNLPGTKRPANNIENER